MPFQKGNQYGKRSKRVKIETKEEKKPEVNAPVINNEPIFKSVAMYKDANGWNVDVLDIQGDKVVKRQNVCPSTLKAEAVESFKITFAQLFIFET